MMKRKGSLSARRVWIEITILSVPVQTYLSLSARRVWIEIAETLIRHAGDMVTLREEGVD